MDLNGLTWAILSFSYVGTMSCFAFVLGICNSRISRKTFLKNTLWIIIGLYILSFVFIRYIYRWHFLLETMLLMIILFAWIAGRKCQLAGLTGGIACGKSTAAEIMTKQKLSVVDCDKIAREVIKKMSSDIIKAFPSDNITNDNGELDFKKLSMVVFGNREKLKKLNKMTHWKIGIEIIKEILYRKFRLWETYVVLDMPLLFETKIFAYICHPIVVIYVDDKELQIKRLIERSNGEMTREDAIKRIDSQLSF